MGHLYGCGNTEERLRLENLGCAARGHPSLGYFDHSTGRGWVRARRGCYHDGIFNKRNTVDVILHETIGGGFSPPGVSRICSLSRKAASGTDRTRYTSRRPISCPISYKKHHTQRLSLNVVKGDAAGILTAQRKLVASLSSSPAAATLV